MKIFIPFIITLSVFWFGNKALGQLLVNTTWHIETGMPDPEIEWSATIADGPFGGPIVVGNTVTENEGANILTTVLHSYGDIVWEQQWNAADSANDYGSSVLLHGDTLIVGGASQNQAQNAYDYVVLAYDIADGTLLWTKLYNGTGNSHDIVSSLATDSVGGIYVTGGSVGSTTLTDYVTLKLDISDGDIIWQNRYDYNDLHDGAVKILFVDGSVMVTGGSANMINDWDICTLELDAATGSQLAERRSGNSSYYFDQPTDMKQDSAGNIFVCGRTKNTNGDEDIKLIKMASDLDLLWERTLDISGDDDGANAIITDSQNNVYLTGYYTTEESTKGFVAYKLDSNGDSIWSKQFPAPWGQDFIGTDIDTRNNNFIYTGFLEGEHESTDLLVYLLDENGNQKMFQPFDLLNAGIADEKGLTANFVDDNVFVILGSAVNPAIGITRYLNLRYEFQERDMTPTIIDSLPAYHSTEMIARFRTDVLNYDFIDNENLRFAKLEDVITPTALLLMDTVLDMRTKYWTVSKIFPYLTSTNETMLNAHGIEVELPQFYSWLTLSIPKDETIEEIIPVLDELNDVFVDVSFNQCILPFSTPNDVGYIYKQKSLHLSDSLNVSIYPYHIDIEPA